MRTPPSELLRRVLSAALAASEPRARVRAVLSTVPRPRRVRALALGKAAAAMLDGARDAWALAPDEGRAFGGAHPIPDASSVQAAEEALAFAADGGDALRLFLVSGGASAMLCAPWPDGSLALKQQVTQKLLGAGLDVAAINVVRAHLSRIKGGWLARAAGDAPRHTVVVSDVLVGDANAVGSGPTLPDATTIDDARRIAARAGLVDLPFHETPKDLAPEPLHVASSPADLVEETARVLREQGFAPTILAPSIASPDALAAEYAALAATLAPGAAVLRVAEPTLVLPPAPGRGGRSTHLAALVARALPEGVAFLAAATDGVDGTSGTAGAVVTSSVPNWDDALAAFATGPAHVAAGTALPQRPTGNNLADLHVLLRAT